MRQHEIEEREIIRAAHYERDDRDATRIALGLGVVTIRDIMAAPAEASQGGEKQEQGDQP